MLAYNAIAQTAIVAIRNDDEILIAADSKGLLNNNPASPILICKIKKVLRRFYIASGIYENRAIGFNVSNIIDTTFKDNRAFQVNINRALENIKSDFPRALTEIRNRDSIAFRDKFERKDSVVLSIVFAGIENSQLIMYKMDFKMHRYKNISFTIVPKSCGLNCSKIYFLGQDSAMTVYSKNHPWNPRMALADYAKKLIEEAIRHHPAAVGMPIDILQIPRIGNPIWIQRKPQCHN
ncbi:hypothetical protein L0244_39990 [bacterium]|nr:hypothetical protein [bacterium]